MPEGDVHIFGSDTHIPKKGFPVLLGAAAVVGFLALRSRSQAAAPTGPTVDSQLASNVMSANAQSLEFYQIQQQAAREIAQMTAANAIEKQQLNQSFQLAAGLNPGLLKQCIPFSQWYSLGNDVRKGLTDQVRNGQLFQSVGPDGICFAPTQMGIQGHPALVTSKSSQGLFGGSASVTGPAGSVPQTPPRAPDPGLFGLIDVLTTILKEAGVITPTPVPRNPNPYPYPSV